VDWGIELEESEEGFRLGAVIVSALLFADDLVLCARTAAGLHRLLRLSIEHARRLELTISQKKSMVLSPAADTWDLKDADGEIYASMDKIMSYKYLGLETFNTMGKTSTAKQKKCLVAARRYRGACRYLSRQGPDVVDVALCAWSNVAIPSILFASESVRFSETTLAALDSEQARWAKETLGLPSKTPNVVAQLLLGVPTFKEIIFKAQLKFFMRLSELPASRYAAQALVEHESGGWRSPYLLHISAIQVELDLVQLPPEIKMVDEVVETFCRTVLNDKLRELSSVPVDMVTAVRRARSAREGEAWRWVNRAVMGASMIRYSAVGEEWRNKCGPDQVVNSDLHCVSCCSKTREVRARTGMNSFFTSCRIKGVSATDGYRNFVLGLDNQGNEVDMDTYKERGQCLMEIFESVMVGPLHGNGSARIRILPGLDNWL
jgi:hypothetical protein